MIMQREEFAKTSWSIDDVLDAAEEAGVEMAEDEAYKWIEENELTIRDEIIRLGYEVIINRLSGFQA